LSEGRNVSATRIFEKNSGDARGKKNCKGKGKVVVVHSIKRGVEA
jgi:hypothetical protein